MSESTNLPNSSPIHPRLKSLARKHSRLESRLEELRSRLHLTPEEEYEETRLKKEKLALKDEMEQIRRELISA